MGVICAGTADLPVAEEAAVTLECFGRRVERILDVGVAGIHRVLAETDRIRSCGVLIVVAGMEGALPGVVSGLVDKPLIAVPTSVGYGASFGGLAALLGMLNCCGSGVTVVNIDNGFGAACAADDILRSSFGLNVANLQPGLRRHYQWPSLLSQIWGLSSLGGAATQAAMWTSRTLTPARFATSRQDSYSGMTCTS